jgi:hypothetical protein
MSTVLNQVANDPSMTGFGSHSAREVEELQKALSISQNYGTTAPNALTGGSALAIEDLDRTLKLVTHGLEHLRLWKDILKEKVTQTVHEYNVQNSYGQEVSPFFAMGGTPQETDANYDREVIQVKYLGTQGQVQHNLTLIQAAHGPVVAREVKNKTIELLARNERAMFEADSTVNALEYDGIFAQINYKQFLAAYQSTAFAGYYSSSASLSVIMDQRGGELDEDLGEEAGLTAVNNFGMPMDMYLGTDIHSEFSRSYYQKQRVMTGATLVAGQKVKEFSGTLDYRFKPSLFNRPRISPLAVAVAAEAAPTTGSVTTPVDANSQFTASSAGAYSYQISAVYADGETLPCAAFSASPAAGDNVSVVINFSGTPLYLNIFRSAMGASSGWEFTQRIAPAASGSVFVIDENAYLPGNAKAFLLMHDPDVLCWKQLGSMIKYDLAVTNTSYMWLQLLYGTPLVMAPRKNVVLINLT